MGHSRTRIRNVPISSTYNKSYLGRKSLHDEYRVIHDPIAPKEKLQAKKVCETIFPSHIGRCHEVFNPTLVSPIVRDFGGFANGAASRTGGNRGSPTPVLDQFSWWTFGIRAFFIPGADGSGKSIWLSRVPVPILRHAKVFGELARSKRRTIFSEHCHKIHIKFSTLLH